MNLIIRLIILSATCLLASCATPYLSNPWETPNRYIRIPLSEQAQFNASLQPCIEHARKTYAEANYRFQNGLPDGGNFYAIVFNDQEGTSYIEVDSSASGLIRGYVNFGNSIKGEVYAAGDSIILDQSDLIDWSITYPDRPADGNLLSKYILLKQDGLAAGDCDPTDIELQHYRYFSVNYSFAPPGTDSWELGEPGDGVDVMMQEKDEDLDEIYTISSARYRIPLTNSDQQLIKQVRTLWNYDDEAGVRYNVVKLEADTFTKKEARCARAQHTVEDKEALLAASGKRGLMITDVQTLLCVHPAVKQLAVVLNYSHLHHPGKRDSEFIIKADKVFESLAFTTQYY
jgi:hypothetical protein